MSAELNAGLAAGYDSNPAQSNQAVGRAFLRSTAAATWTTPLPSSTLSMAFGGWHQDYAGQGANGRLMLNGAWSRKTAAGTGQFASGLEVAAYRDTLVPADERDEAAITLDYAHLLSARHSLGLSGELRWLDYRNAASPWAGRPGSSGGRAGNQGNGSQAGGTQEAGIGFGDPAGTAIARRRHDTLLGLGLDLSRHWTPSLTTLLSLAYAHCSSSVPLEAYDRYGLGVTLRFQPATWWDLEAGVGWSTSRYPTAPRRLERTDTERSLTLRFNYALSDNERAPIQLSCGLEWVDSASTLASRAFDQQVTHCGLSWSLR